MAAFRRLRQTLGLRRGRISKYVEVGRSTYGVNEFTVLGASAKTPVVIGSYCSLAAGVQIIAEGEHPLDRASTFAFTAASRNLGKGPIRIGSDVWIGSRAIILSGITIGNGAVIGAGAIVTRDVPPYAIVAGNPARLIRYRFPPETIAALEKIAWWDWPADKVERERGAFDLPIGEFIKRFGGETDRAEDRGGAAGAAGQD